MTLAAIKSGAMAIINRAAFSVNKIKPELFVGAGVLGTGVATFMACKATTKLDEEMRSIRDDFELAKSIRQSIKDVEEGKTDAVIVKHKDGTPYTAKDARKCTFTAVKLAFIRFAKLYGPAALVYAASIFSILHGFGILKSNYTSMAAVAAGAYKTLTEYRKRVGGLIGEDKEELLFRGAKVETFYTDGTNSNGEACVVSEEKAVVREGNAMLDDPLVFLFDECNAPRGFDAKGYGNFDHLRAVLHDANKMLKGRGKGGWVMLTEVLEKLGYSQEAQIPAINWCWYNDPEKPLDDNRIDFGIYEYLKSVGRLSDPDGIRSGCSERTYILRFNCDGMIGDLIKDSEARRRERKKETRLAKLRDRAEKRARREQAGAQIVDIAMAAEAV